jgi:hypothetical protein
MKKISLFLPSVSILLTGCAANGFYEGYSSTTPENIEKYNEKIFLGIPVALAFEGSSVRINDEWVATAAHNKVILLGREVYYHPRCDFALIRDKTDKKTEYPKVGFVYENVGYNEVYHVGYPLLAPLSSHKGKYLGDVSNPTDNCYYSATDSTVISGMSGGGVYNKYGEVVGVTIGIMFKNIKWDKTEVKKEHFAPSVFMPFLAVEDFIHEVTGIEYYPDTVNLSNPLTYEEKADIQKQLKESKYRSSSKTIKQFKNTK